MVNNWTANPLRRLAFTPDMRMDSKVLPAESITPITMTGYGLSTWEIIYDIRRVARRLGHSPSSVEYKRVGKYDLTTVRRKFGLSWKEIKELAGLRYTERTSARIPLTEELGRDLQRVAKEIGHPPTCSDYLEHGRFSYGVLRRRSGQKKWDDIVASLAGFVPEEIKRHRGRGGMRYRTTEERLAQLRDISRELGHAPTTQEANRFGLNAHDLRGRIGGSWEEVLKAAGIKLSSRTRHSILRSTQTVQLLEDVLRVARRLGHVPTMREYQLHGRYSCSTLRGRLGGWRNVKKEVQGLMNRTLV